MNVIITPNEKIFEAKKLERFQYFTTNKEDREFFKSNHTAKVTIFESKRILEDFFKRYFEIQRDYAAGAVFKLSQ